MRTSTCRITLFAPAIKGLTDAVAPALAKTAELIHEDLQQSQTMPFDTGTLQNKSTFVDDKDAELGEVDLVSSTPYARRLYYHPEYNFQTHENQNAGGRWLEPYLPGGKKETFAQETFAKVYRKEAGL